MSETKQNYLALSIESESKQALQQLITSLSQCNLLDVCYAYKSRVKSEDRLLEKVARKKSDNKPDYALTDITDVVGIRFVTLFRKEMPEVLKILINIIKNKIPINPNPFVEDHFEELIIYSSNIHDEIVPIIKEMINEEDVCVIKNGGPVDEVSKQGYSSIHLVARLIHTVKKLSAETAYNVPVEIQIRTVFEDAWGEIDHKYGYLLRSGKEAGKPIYNSDHVLSHLKILKKFSDACAEYADAIHDEATTDPKKEIESGVVISVVADEEIVERLAELGVSVESVDKFKLVRSLRQDGRDLFENNKEQSIQKYLLSAELSREVMEPIDATNLNKDNMGEYLSYYYFKMNEAICLMSTNISEKIKGAFLIYSHLLSIYQDFPLLRMRLAQAYGKLGMSKESISHFAKTLEQINDFENNGCCFDDSLPETDYKHVKKYLAKLYGFQLWYRGHYMDVTNEQDLQEKVSLLKQAYEVTSTRLMDIEEGDVEQLTTIYNNLMYYAIELSQYSNKGVCDLSKILDDIPQLYKTLEGLVDVTNTDDLEYLDTLSKVYNHFGDKDRTIAAVDKIIDITLDGSKNYKYDRAEMLEIAQEAFSLKQTLIGQ